MDRRADKRPKSSWPSNVATIAGLLLCLVLGALLVCNVTIIVKGMLSPEMPPSVFGITPLVVRSGSMSGKQAGHIEVGDLVLVRQIDPAELAVGDVITYLDEGITVTHRIIAIDNTGTSRQFTTQGDANDTPDTDPVTEAQLVGIYLGRISCVGDAVLFLQKNDVNLKWNWPYSTSEENDIKDTYLGDIAASLVDGKTAPNINITFSTTVTQVD